MTCHQHLTFPPSCHNLLYLRPSNSPHFSFVTDVDLRGRNVLHIDPIATCSLRAYHLFTLHRSMSLYQIKLIFIIKGLFKVSFGFCHHICLYTGTSRVQFYCYYMLKRIGGAMGNLIMNKCPHADSLRDAHPSVDVGHTALINQPLYQLLITTFSCSQQWVGIFLMKENMQIR